MSLFDWLERSQIEFVVLETQSVVSETSLRNSGNQFPKRVSKTTDTPKAWDASAGALRAVAVLAGDLAPVMYPLWTQWLHSQIADCYFPSPEAAGLLFIVRVHVYNGTKLALVH